jgi:hypothetical protein
MGLLLIPQVKYEHGEPWWNEASWRTLLICPTELSDNPTSSHLIAKQEELAKKMIHFALQSISFILQSILQHAEKSYYMEPMAFLPLRRKAFCTFLLPLKTQFGQFQTCKPWVQWQAQ